MTSTTVSTTRYWKRFERAWRVVLLGLALAGLSAVRAEGIVVQSAHIETTEEGYALVATFDIAFSSTLEDALNRGVALNFLVEFELIRPRWFWVDERIVAARREWRLSYNALTRQYRLSSGSLYQNFDRLEDAKQVLSATRIPLGERGQLGRGTAYAAAVRMRLDVSRLPKPFQVSAITGRDWNLASDWHRFTFTP